MRRLRYGSWLLVLHVGCASAPVAAPGPALPDASLTAGVSGRERLVPIPAAHSRAVAGGTRSESGAPGPDYWQNSVSYRIEAELDPETATLRGSERIVYRNNSPTPLPSILLNLYQNVFSANVPRNRFVPVTGGTTLDRVAAQGQSLERRPTSQIPIGGDPVATPAGYSVQGTLGRIRLPTPLAPGDSVVLEIDWQHDVPPVTSFRTAWEDALGARAFQVAQWYPQIATYDDVRGWDVTPYLGDGEFYLEYGDFDVSITVPAGFLVGATGELMNPEEVLTDESRRRLEAAIDSDSITRVVTAADLTAENATQSASGGQLTWRFRATDSRDFAFATSSGYVWDATRAAMPDGRIVTVHALYRPGAPNWENAAGYGQHSIAYFDRLLVPYAYPQITVAEGPIGGMEYPMIVFIGKPPSVEALYGVIAHEISHEWFPMMIGQDEAAHAWMDEGAATYLEGLAVGDYFANDDPFAADRAGYLSVAGAEIEVPLMRHTDLVSPYGARIVAAYIKPGLLLRSLHAVMGEDLFRQALDAYSTEWMFKHPTAWDLFNTFERFAGRSLDWFFYPWWFETGVLDQAITAVVGAETGRAVVTISDLGDNPAPTPLVATLANGDTLRAEVPVESWLSGARSVTITLEASAAIVEITIDPKSLFPDVDPDNNRWTASTTP